MVREELEEGEHRSLGEVNNLMRAFRSVMVLSAHATVFVLSESFATARIAI